MVILIATVATYKLSHEYEQIALCSYVAAHVAMGRLTSIIYNYIKIIVTV